MTKIGLAFYTKEEWTLLKQCSKDEIDDTYENWKQGYEEVKRNLKRAGKDYLEVPVNMAEMNRYFEEHNLENTSENRSAYVAEKLRSSKT